MWRREAGAHGRAARARDGAPWPCHNVNVRAARAPYITPIVDARPSGCPRTASICAAVLAYARHGQGRVRRARDWRRPMALKRKHADAVCPDSDQPSKILNLGKKSWASQRAINRILCSLRRPPHPSICMRASVARDWRAIYVLLARACLAIDM